MQQNIYFLCYSVRRAILILFLFFLCVRMSVEEVVSVLEVNTNPIVSKDELGVSEWLV